MPQFCRDFGHFFQLAYRDFWSFYREFLLTLMGTGNYSAISNNMKLVHWPLMGELLRLVQR